MRVGRRDRPRASAPCRVQPRTRGARTGRFELRRAAARWLPLAGLLVALAALVVPPGLARGAPDAQPAAQGAGRTFEEAFTGRPAAPEPWRPASWDVSVHSRDRETWRELEPMLAHHGPDCAAEPANHPISRYEDAVFLCNDHVMTAINAEGYGLIYLTPNQLVDFSEGEAVVRFDLSTLRTSPRDWVDVWLSPYEDHLQLPLEHWLPDLAGEPRRAIHVRMDSSDPGTFFRADVFRGDTLEEIKGQWWIGYESFLTPSAVRRDTLEIRVSRTSLKIGMPAYNHWWVDTPIADLGWDRAVLQLGHHSYTPTKDCRPGACAPNTWHWDSLSIDPAIPFTIIRGDRRWASAEDGPTVSFAAPAPEGSHLRFAAIGSAIEISYDGGGSWQPAQPRPVRRGEAGDDVFVSYWTPMPAGAQSVTIRGRDWYGAHWAARDLTVWSRN